MCIRFYRAFFVLLLPPTTAASDLIRECLEDFQWKVGIASVLSPYRCRSLSSLVIIIGVNVYREKVFQRCIVYIFIQSALHVVCGTTSFMRLLRTYVSEKKYWTAIIFRFLWSCRSVFFGSNQNGSSVWKCDLKLNTKLVIKFL